MCCNRSSFINPWESPFTSPWRDFWDEDVWRRCVICDGRTGGNGGTGGAGCNGGGNGGTGGAGCNGGNRGRNCRRRCRCNGRRC